MTDSVISVQGLSKMYKISHQAEKEPYVALRDVMIAGLENIARAGMDAIRGRTRARGNQIEEFWALRDVNFDIARGEVVGIVGRNGAGKSTLLKVLSRITEPSAGRVEIKGRVASLLEIGTGFHSELTGRENIYLNGAILGMSRGEIRRKFDEIVAFADVEQFLDTPVKRYSSGMYVRLAFAVAAHLEPEILIVDEVLAVGDHEFQRKCLGKMKDIAGHGRTVLFVSHNLAAVSALCTRGLLLSRGRIVAEGPIAEIVADYASVEIPSYSIAFVADPTRMSITAVSVEREALRAKHLIVDIGVALPRWVKSHFCRVSLRSQLGAPVWSSDWRVDPLPDTAAQCIASTIRCEAYDLPIIPGRYTLSVRVFDWHEEHDLKSDILTLVVGDEIHSPSSANGLLSWPATWRTVS